MASWGDLVVRQPRLAGAGRDLLYQHGVGLAFLATVGTDGRPRVHPMCPILDGDEAYAFIVPSPKQQDLRRNGWYAMHSFPCPDNEDAFYLTGTAHLVEDETVRDALGRRFVDERSQLGVPAPAADDLLFRFDIDRCLLTRTTGHGDPSPSHTVWRAD